MKENFFKKFGRFTALFVAVSMIGGISAAYAAPAPNKGGQQPKPQQGQQKPAQPAPQKPAPQPKPEPPKPAPAPAPPAPAPDPAPRHDSGKDDFIKGAITGAVLGVVLDRAIN